MQEDILGFIFQEITPLLNEIIALKVVHPEMSRDYEPVDRPLKEGYRS